ncbi:hypothetical protein JXA84_10005 [candidate division WOR-3 bacterium]|nr:hypothetical protein [candidate division WOR-3 bacterium]
MLESENQIAYCELYENEFDTIWKIDRSEYVEAIYLYKAGKLERQKIGQSFGKFLFEKAVSLARYLGEKGFISLRANAKIQWISIFIWVVG